MTRKLYLAILANSNYTFIPMTSRIESFSENSQSAHNLKMLISENYLLHSTKPDLSLTEITFLSLKTEKGQIYVDVQYNPLTILV